MRGSYTPHTEHPLPVVGRELEPTPLRPETSRLHVERPCYVGRHDHERWAWTCALCPMPLRLATFTAATWQSAIDAATAHVRSEHGDGPQATPVYEFAA